MSYKMTREEAIEVFNKPMALEIINKHLAEVTQNEENA